MKQRKYFEVFASVGRKSVPSKDFPYTVDALLADMEYARIHGAAIISNAAEAYSYMYGNREALALACGNSKLAGSSSNPAESESCLVGSNFRLAAIAAVPPTAILETGDTAFYKRLLEEGFCAFAAFYKRAFRTSLHPKSMEPMVEALLAHQKPLIIPGPPDVEWYEQISRLAQAYPELPIIMQGTTWGLGRAFCEVMDRHENLYFEISSNHINNILEFTRKHFGIERAMYSSAWPDKSMGAMKSLIEYADLTEDEKDLVAHGNACRLFGIDPENLPFYDDAVCRLDPIAREADAGMPISVPVIDSHTHMVDVEDQCVSSSMMPQSDCHGMVRKMERLGIDKILTTPWSGISIDGQRSNESVLYAAQVYPGKVLGYSACNVHYDEDRQSWERYHTAYPELFVGVKPYWPAVKVDLTDKVYEEWFSYANEHHLLLLIHGNGSDAILSQAEMLSVKYPDLTIILAHSGESYAIARKHAALARERDNVVLEITYTTTTRGIIEFLVAEVGADKVLYGSDQPMRDPSPQLGWVCYADISYEDKKKVLGGNIQRLLDRRI